MNTTMLTPYWIQRQSARILAQSADTMAILRLAPPESRPDLDPLDETLHLRRCDVWDHSCVIGSRERYTYYGWLKWLNIQRNDNAVSC